MKNVLSIFEGRINDIFVRGGSGAAPITFKKLAKRTIREMENETFVIDGVDTAPSLYTVLVSANDDRVMRPLYVNITDEISSLVEAQAKKRGYSFVGKPLVRFMIDPSLKAGKFAVFAENIDPRTLARLREEENAFLGIEQQPLADTGAQEEDGFSIIPEDSVPVSGDPEPGVDDTPDPEPVVEEFHEPAPQEELQEPNDGPAETPAEANTPPEAPESPSAPSDTLSQQADDSSEQNAAVDGEPSPAPSNPDGATSVATCTLTDQQTGKVYTISSTYTQIGREHVPGAIVLRDPNVSRRHAELTYDGSEWHIHDLNSTNGTLVNDIDIEECSLRDGDVLTIGLINFIFRER